MTLQSGDLLAITRPAGPQAGTYQLPVAALAEQLSPPPVLGISGLLWSTVRSAADNNWQAVCWSPELQLYACVANTGSSNRVMTSTDGIRWSAQPAAADQNWVALCWAAALGLFVAVSDSGTGQRVMTSADGRSWTLRQTPADNSWTSICWAPELHLLVAVASSGTGNRVMTSSDGLTWAAGPAAADQEWRSICWAPQLGLLVAVSSSGGSQRVDDLSGWPQLDAADCCRSQQLDGDLLGGGAGPAGSGEQQRPGQPGDDFGRWHHLDEPDLAG